MIKTIKQWNYEHTHYIAMAAATLISGIIAGVAAIGSSIAQNVANSKAVSDTNSQNRDLTEQAWQRDDAQLQRARQDAEKAGFSPLAALSSNLTNTSPATMQAPQYDFSGIGEGAGKIADAPRSAKASRMEERLKEEQIAGAHEQARSLKLDNDLKDQTHDNNIVKSSMELMRLKKELDGMDLSNYEKASILVANGMKADLAKQIVGTDVNAHTGEVAAENYTKAQTSLAYAQITDMNSMRSYHQDLLRWEAQVSHLQADKDAKLNHYWYDTLPKDSPSIQFKKMNMKTGKLEDDFIVTAGRSRFEAMEEYERKYAQLQTDIQKYASEHNTPMEWMNSIWGNINGTVNAASSFFMPSTTTYQSFEYNNRGQMTGSTRTESRSSGYGR